MVNPVEGLHRAIFALGVVQSIIVVLFVVHALVRSLTEVQVEFARLEKEG